MSKLPFETYERRILDKKVSKTNSKFGQIPIERKTSDLINYGIVNLDKPRGPTSHQTTDYVKKILGVNKAGHSGTLDPKVTGVLPIALGRGTRIVQGLLTAGKEYIAIMHLHKLIDEDVIRENCEKFIGKIKQLPPIKSSVKRQLRFRKIYYLEILEIKGQDVLLVTGTQAGTYIRKLIHDIGQSIGCGAHMAELRRTKAGPFDESTLVTLQDLADAYHYYKEESNDTMIRTLIQPLETAVSHLAKVWVIDTTVDSLCHGASLKLPGISKLESDIQVDDSVAIMTLKNELIAFGVSRMTSKEMHKNNKGVAVSSNKVFMQTGIYPRVDPK